MPRCFGRHPISTGTAHPGGPPFMSAEWGNILLEEGRWEGAFLGVTWRIIPGLGRLEVFLATMVIVVSPLTGGYSLSKWLKGGF